jgi:hypothetical protein
MMHLTVGIVKYVTGVITSMSTEFYPENVSAFRRWKFSKPATLFEIVRYRCFPVCSKLVSYHPVISH